MNLFRRLGKLVGRGGVTRVRATHEDLYYCYRLILRREPDPAGVGFWTQQIDQHHISLIDRFLESEKFLNSSFARTLASGSALTPLDVGEFKIYIAGDDFGVGAALKRDKVWEPHQISGTSVNPVQMDPGASGSGPFERLLKCRLYQRL